MDWNVIKRDGYHEQSDRSPGPKLSDDGIDIKPSESDNEIQSIMDREDSTRSIEDRGHYSTDDGEFLQTMIIHDNTSELGEESENNDTLGSDPAAKTSKELASDEVISDSNIAMGFLNNIKPSGESSSSSRSTSPIMDSLYEMGIVKPKSVKLKNYQPVYIEKYANYDIYTPKQDINFTSDARKLRGRIEKNRSVEEPYNSEDDYEVINHDDVDEEDIDSFSILDNLEEFGAVGGRNVEEEPTCSRQNDGTSSFKEKLSSILHRQSSIGRRSSSVHFDESVNVETFSPTEPASDCFPKLILAKGDGPVYDPAPGNMYGPFLPPTGISNGGLNDIPNTTMGENTDRERLVAYTQSNTIDSASQSNPVDSLPNKGKNLIHRKNSTPRVMSPTEMLRKKQRKVTDKIINGIKSSNKVPNDHKEDTQPVPGTSSFKENLKYFQVNQQISEDNGNNYDYSKPTSKKLVRLNSSDFIDPKYLKDFPDNNEKSNKVLDGEASDSLPGDANVSEQTHTNNAINGEQSVYNQPDNVSDSSLNDDVELVNNMINTEASCNKRFSDSNKEERVDFDDKKEQPKSQKNKCNPGHWFFKSFDSSFSGSFDKSTDEQNCSQQQAQNWDYSNEISSLHVLPDKVPNTNIDGKNLKDKRILERCRKKRRLDELRQLTLERSQTNLEMPNDQPIALPNVETNIDGSLEQASNSQEVNADEQRNAQQSSENGVLHNDQAQGAIDYMNSLLNDFLTMIKMKRERCIPVDVDDYRELELIQTTILSISNRLSSLTEPPDPSTSSPDSPIDAIQEGGSSVLHIDSHDRNIVQRQLDELRMCLKSTEKNMQSWSNPSVNTSFSEGKRTYKEPLNDKMIASDRTQFIEYQNQLAEKIPLTNDVDTAHNNQRKDEQIENFGPISENYILHNAEAQGAIDYMNSLLNDFLAMIKMKRAKGIPVDVDDYRELELIQTTILSISNRLSSLTEPPDPSTSSPDSPIESIQEGGSSVLHIDSHDRNIVQRQLDELRMCLKSTEKNLQSLSNPSVNTAVSDQRTYKEQLNDRRIANEGIQSCCEFQNRPKEESNGVYESDVTFDNERNHEQIGNYDSMSENNRLHNGEVQGAINHMNALLNDFLNMIKLKKAKGIPVDVDDYRELELIQTTIKSISNRLDLLTEPLDTSAPSSESIDTNTEGGSSVLHIDYHDRGLVKRHLNRLRSSLKNTEKNMHSWSNPSINRVHSESKRTPKEMLCDSNSASERMQYNGSQIHSGYLYRRSQDQMRDSLESFTYPRNIDSLCSGYLGDQNESEYSIPDAYSRKQVNMKKGARRQVVNDIQDTKIANQDSYQDVDYDGAGHWENESFDDMSQSVSLRDFMSTSSVSASRDTDWSTDRGSRGGYHTGHYGGPADVQSYPAGFQWSRIAHGNGVNADCIYPGFYLADNVSHRQASSTEPQVHSMNDGTLSNLSLTRNPYFNEQSSSEFENEDWDDNYQIQQVHTEMRPSPTTTTAVRPEELNDGSVVTYGEDMNIELIQKEGSPVQGQRLYGSSQNLDRRGDAGVSKRKQPGARSLTPDSRSFMMEREVNDSQYRKLQMENSTLQTENKLLKEKNNRSQARISDLESQLAEAQEDLNTLQDNLNQEVSNLSSRTQKEIEKGRDEMQTKILVLSKESEALKAEVSSLEKRLEGAQRTTDMARHNSEKARTIDAYKLELATMKEELNRVKALLDQSEKHLREEEERHTDTTKQVLKLTELKNALQQQSDAGGSGAIVDKQMKSLEKRLKVTEERLHHERSDRANNLSTVEEKLLTDNSSLQASEKDLKRQLQREKEKNRNLDHRVKQLREDNEKLRIALPFDESVLVADSHKYDIPYGSHSSQRAETMKNLSDDMNYILSQIEKQDGLSAGQEEEIICVLWNKRELAYKHLREYELQIEELQIHDNNNIVDGLKNLRDTYSQSEGKLRAMEEKMEDTQSQMAITDATYKQQLNELVKERHEAFAKLKTAEDLLEAVRAENESLRRNVSLTHAGGSSGQGHLSTGENFEVFKQDLISSEGKVAQLRRTNEKLEGELTTARVQLDARNKALEDVNCELDLAYKRLQGEEVDDHKQIKIDKLTSQVANYQIELKSWTDRYNIMVTEKSKLETELSLLKQSTSPPKGRQQKMEQIASKELQKIKEDLIDKESRLGSVSKQLDDRDHELQQVRQELYGEQMHTSEMEDELDTLQHTASQRAQMFEALSGSEREQLAQYQILKETLDTVNQELAQKQAQIISLDVNLSGQRDRTVELEHEVERLRRERQDSDEVYTEEEQNSAHQLRIGVLEQERAQLKQELSQAYTAIQAAEEQYRTLQTETSQIEQELVKEKTIILQITAEKGEIEQHLEELAEEHDALIHEKNQVEEDLIKLETKLQEILQKYEAEAKKQHSDFTRDYPNLPPEGRKLVSELDSLRLVVEGKNREIEMHKDKLSRCNMEIDFLNRKVELVHNDSISNREDVARMISELTLKMKEAVSTREVNQYLVEERTKLQNQKTHLERELEQERKTNDDRKREITDVIRKIERTETHKKSVEKDSKDKAGTIATLEVELRNNQHSLKDIDSENTQLKTKLEHLNHDLKNLTVINESLEKRLDMEKGTLSEEKSSLSKLQEDHSTMSRDFQVLQHDYKVLCDKYETELKNVDNLNRDLEIIKREKSDIKEELETMKIDLDSQKGQLVITKESVQKLTHDKGSIYQDYESMCRTLTEKERQLTELKARSEEKLELVHREHAQETRRLEEHKNTATQECEAVKKEMESLNEQLKQKEIQLSTFGKTLQELETVTREKRAIENQFQRLESSSGDSQLLLEGQRKEIMALNESLAKLQEKSIHVEAENYSLESQLKSEKDNSNRETQELKLMVKELKSQHENERHYLNENLAQTQNRLRSVETSLSSVSKERDQLNGHQRIKEKAIEDLQAELSDETTGRRLAEKSVGTLRLQLDDAKNAKNVAEARFTEMQAQLNKAETQYKTEQEKNQQLLGKVQELQAVTHTTETSVRAKSEHMETLQKEISKLKQLIDSQKQSHLGKMKKASLEFKQQLDLAHEEKDKLVVQVQQIAADLDACREHVANKNKENLKLQEESLIMEDSLRESKTKQKHAEETLKIELEKQAQLSSRFRDQDEELKRLRNFLAKKVEESGDADKSMWHDMNRVIQELSKQMANHLDAQKSGGGAKEGDGQSVVRYKKQITELQSDLNTEKSLHQITKTSLQALEEDCQRLRHQLQSWRRRDPHSSEKKYKNRMEAINAIIAKSQTQAQALLASGGYLGNTMYSPRAHPNRPGYGSPQHNDSPDNSYSEDLSIASLPPLHYGSPTKYP